MTKQDPSSQLLEIAMRIRDMRDILGYSMQKMAELTEVSEENYKIYGYRWPNDYMKSHKQDYLDGKMHGYAYDRSEYNYDSTMYGNVNSDYCMIYFYEWSSLDGNQRKFYSYSNFYRFCDDCGIKVSEEDKSQLRGMTIAYITCIPGKNELMSACTSYALQSLLDKYKTEHKEEVKA